MTLHTGTTGPPIRALNMEPEVLRQIIQSELGGSSSLPGLVGPGDFAVTQNGTPNMSVNVASGFAFVAGTNNAPVQGMYHAYNDTTVNLTIAASNATNPRIDVICITVPDAFYAGASNTAVLQVITGTAGASPAVPAVPANSLVLAHIYVGANVTSITNSNINSTAGSGNPDTTAYAAPWCGSTQQGRGILQNGYAQITSNPPAWTTTIADVPGLSITVNVAAGRRIRLTGYFPTIVQNTAVGTPELIIREGATSLQLAVATGAAATYQVQLTAIAILQPSAGVHTYKLSGLTSNSTASPQAAAQPSFIMAEDIGAW